VERIKNDLKKAVYENKQARRNRLEIGTKFNFLLNINGWRLGKVHVLLGTTSSGKSTLMRSIISDVIENNNIPKVSCFLSEETSEDYKLELYQGFKNLDFESRVDFYSEQDASSESARVQLLEQAFESESKILIYDNLTTSSIYGEDFQKQSTFITNLKRAAIKTNKALILVAHTNNVHRNGRELIDSGHVRGSKTVANIAEFFFVNHQISVDTNIYNFIQIEKHRGQEPESKLFRLDYAKGKRLYVTDRAQSFSDFKELWKMRDKL